MRVVIQRVSQAEVKIDDESVGRIEKGLLVYLGVGSDDTQNDAEFIADKLVNLRIFPDEAGKMNLSVADVGGSILVVSNFTLHGDCRKGRRPSFDTAAAPEAAERLYEKTMELIAGHGITVEKGGFGKYMHVACVNDGPVTLMLDSKRLF